MRTLCIRAVIFMGLALCPGNLAAETVKPGEPLPSFTLPVPEDPSHRAYLGISAETGDFKTPDIKAPVVIIEIFSMYCPHCQVEAPIVNRLFKKIEGTPSLKDRIKVIGIGVGNSPFEVNVFRKRYNIRFPLFPDGGFKIHEIFGQVRTPCFIGIRLKEDGTNRVIHRKIGGLGGLDHFVDMIIEKAGLEK